MSAKPTPAATGFDLAILETQTRSEAGIPMEVIHPRSKAPVLTREGTPVTVTLLGRNSEICRDAQRRVQERRAERVAKQIKLTPDDLRRDEYEILVDCTVGWTFDQLDGQPFPFNRENARKLWSDRRFDWIFERAVQFIMEDGNFLAP